MLIAGFRKTSLIDYPDYISTVIFTQGCNFRCPYCHNPELIPVEKDKVYLETDDFEEFLEERGHLLDGVVITGGEPTLQTDLPEFIEMIKKQDLKVKLDTNGFCYQVLVKLLENNLIDYLALDVKATWEKYSQLTGISDPEPVKKTVTMIMESEIDYEFRTTVVPGLHNADDVEEIARSIAGARKYYIQNFRPDVTLDPAFQDKTRFPDEVLDQFKERADRYLDQVEVRY